MSFVEVKDQKADPPAGANVAKAMIVPSPAVPASAQATFDSRLDDTLQRNERARRLSSPHARPMIEQAVAAMNGLFETDPDGTQTAAALQQEAYKAALNHALRTQRVMSADALQQDAPPQGAGSWRDGPRGPVPPRDADDPSPDLWSVARAGLAVLGTLASGGLTEPAGGSVETERGEGPHPRPVPGLPDPLRGQSDRVIGSPVLVDHWRNGLRTGSSYGLYDAATDTIRTGAGSGGNGKPKPSVPEMLQARKKPSFWSRLTAPSKQGVWR